MCQICNGDNYNCPVCGEIEKEPLNKRDNSPLPYLDIKESLEEMCEILELANKFDRRIKIYKHICTENPKSNHKLNLWNFFRNYLEKKYLCCLNAVMEITYI